jgi:hypothetical protein
MTPVPAHDLQPGAIVDTSEARVIPGPRFAIVKQVSSYLGQTWLEDRAGQWWLFDDAQLVPTVAYIRLDA